MIILLKRNQVNQIKIQVKSITNITQPALPLNVVLFTSNSRKSNHVRWGKLL